MTVYTVLYMIMVVPLRTYSYIGLTSVPLDYAKPV